MFGCGQKISKSSAIVEALGSLDEINSFLGLCKVKSVAFQPTTKSNICFDTIITNIQNTLFIIQAELAGFPETITEQHVIYLEEITNTIEKDLPRIKTFILSGGTELSALFDVARTLARRAERRMCIVIEEGETKIGQYTKSYLNRLSSVLYACARFANHKAGVTEQQPRY
jgi:cob(I)alamin adenosyltransferase